MAPRWLERHEQSFITLATIIQVRISQGTLSRDHMESFLKTKGWFQIGVTYLNNGLLIMKYSKQALVKSNFDGDNTVSTGVFKTCMNIDLYGWQKMRKCNLFIVPNRESINAFDLVYFLNLFIKVNLWANSRLPFQSTSFATRWSWKRCLFVAWLHLELLHRQILNRFQWPISHSLKYGVLP